MSLQLPGSLTPSKVSTFKECALAFRLSVIDKLPEPPSLQAFKGTVVHRALELLMWEEQPGERTPAAAFAKLERALEELLAGDEGTALALDEQQLEELADDARHLVRNYFVLEDPNTVRVIGTELRLQVDLGSSPMAAPATGGRGESGPSATVATVPVGAFPAVPAVPEITDRTAPAGGRLRLRGIIDRLELDENGDLVVTDYKTGRAPGQSQEQARLGGVHFYAFLCQQLLGRRPARVQLFHLREPIAICSTPDDQSIAGLERQATAIWAAVKRACLAEDFRPKPGRLCDWCGYHAYCPSMGGDLSLVRAAAPDGGAGTGADVALPQLFPPPLAAIG